jgi:Rad3-related DNA helicase
VCIGIPFQYVRSQTLLARLDFLKERHGIKEKDFLDFDALRQVRPQTYCNSVLFSFSIK